MAKYVVPNELYPGVYRGYGKGFFGPGMVVEIPDAERPHRLLKPNDEPSQAVYESFWGEKKPVTEVEPEGKAAPETMTVRQLSEGKGAKRLADSK